MSVALSDSVCIYLPLRIILTPQTPLTYLTPLYSQLPGVITLNSEYGRLLRPSSTINRINLSE